MRVAVTPPHCGERMRLAPRRARDLARARARSLTTLEPSFYACPRTAAAMSRWTIVHGATSTRVDASNDASNDAERVALCAPSAGSEHRAARAQLWVEDEEREALPNACGVVRVGHPVRGGGARTSAAFRATTRDERASARGASIVFARDVLRERSLVVDVYERKDVMHTFALTHAGRDVFEWLAERGVTCATTERPDSDDTVTWEIVDASIRGGANDMLRRDPTTRSTSKDQSANECLMVVPSAFCSNEQAARDNHFMASTSEGMSALEIRERAVAEHKGLCDRLRSLGMKINLFSHDENHGAPDSVFPNNWHQLREGKLKLFPMKDENRRRERREDIIDFLKMKHPGIVVDDSLLRFERQDPPKFLEGTGSLVVDHENRIAYVALSERAHTDVVQQHCADENLTPIMFTAVDAKGRTIYHTNVMMAVCTDVAIVCAASIADESERRRALDTLKLKPGREIIDITHDQVDAFCGNVLEVRTASGASALALSARALAAFNPDQRAILDRIFDHLVVVDFDIIERIGGGGVRCAIAEHFV